MEILDRLDLNRVIIMGHSVALAGALSRLRDWREQSRNRIWQSA
jgi:hypothetical protein